MKKVFQVYFCKQGCGAHRNVEVGADGALVGQTQLTCYYPKFERTDDFAKRLGITVGGTFGVLCLTCGARMAASKRHIRGAFGDSPCSRACDEAEGGECLCSCEGANHGIYAR